MTPLVILERLGPHRAIRRSDGRGDGGRFAGANAVITHSMDEAGFSAGTMMPLAVRGGIIECLLAGSRMPGGRVGSTAPDSCRWGRGDLDRGPARPERPHRGMVGSWLGCEGWVLKRRCRRIQA